MSKTKKSPVETPLMKQYNQIKAKNPDAILLFRVGDFYETFGNDAIKAAEILGITLTRRANGAASFVELAGFPHHALDTYLPKLVRAGQRVAICDQLEDPKTTKTIVKRGITELVTPGVSLNDNVLQHKENNFLAAVHIDRHMAGVSFLDISTGEFFAAEGQITYIDKLLNNFNPKEILVEKKNYTAFISHFGTKFYIYKLDEWAYNTESAREKLLNQLQTKTLKGFGVHQLELGITAAGAVLHYLELTQHHQTRHIRSISRIEEDLYVWLDKFTIRNLELFSSIQENGKTLIEVLDHTISPMGARMLKRWLALPLKNLQQIEHRLTVVEHFTKHEDFTQTIADHLALIGDLERIISKVATRRISPREVIQLKNALSSITPIKNLCVSSGIEALVQTGEQLNPCQAIKEKIEREITPEPPAQMHKGNIIRTGISDELDELRSIMRSGKDYIVQMQERESRNTGIPSLKVGFNNVFGYYIEVRNTHKSKVPDTWIRKQTLVNAERYITEELKEYEAKVLGAEEKILILENEIFSNLVTSLGDYIDAIQLNASQLARLDCLYSFARVSLENDYCRPTLDETEILEITEGRHPVIEKQLPTGEEYISNNIKLDNEKQQIIIITGPNMSGKSALLRQTALIVLMAQAGCFVPAKKASIGLVDKIFTRVGASDNISSGESTFMVEMTEAASILNNISSRSLVLLDEIGRGTSTYDGISIAWAMVEYLHEHPSARAKTLFATHYHELNELENAFDRIKNYNVSVKELENKVIFLRKLKRGGSEHSFGIHVAGMAGMPRSVVSRAEEILKEMENSRTKNGIQKPVGEIAGKREGYQLSIFQLDDPVLKQIRDEIFNLDINNLTPVEALNKLNEIKRLAGLK